MMKSKKLIFVIKNRVNRISPIFHFMQLVLLSFMISGFSQPVDPPYSDSALGTVRLPIEPTRYTENIKQPIITHSWNANLYYNGNDWADPDYPQMISLIANPLCIHVNRQGIGTPKITNMELQYVYNYGQGNPHVRIPHELSDALVVLPKAGKVDTPMVDFISDWGIKLSWNDGTLEAYSSSGSPFIHFHSNDGGITIKTDDSATIWYEKDNAIGIEIFINHFDNGTNTWHCFGSNNYVFYGPTGCTWEKKEDSPGRFTFASDLAGKNYASVASVPNDSAVEKRIENLLYLKRFAFNFVTDTKVEWEYDEKKALVKTKLSATVEKKEETNDGVLFALFPHQWLHYKGPVKDITYNSARGPMKIIETQGSFTTEMKYYGILPHFPLVLNGKNSSEYSQSDLEKLIIDQIDEGEGANVFQANDAYSTSVTIGRTAQLIRIADQIGMTEQRDTLMAWVKRALEDWLSYSGNDDKAWLVYDKRYGAIIGNPPNQGMFSDKHLNDAHFQFGYMIKAAAEIACFDKQWAEDWGERIEILIRYVNNWKRDDPLFPFLRFMDPYCGHSWATGDGDFRDGNNQESSSECMNCYAGIALWGMVTGNKEIRDLGIYLYTTEAVTTLNYWWDINDVCYANGPDHGNQKDAIWEPALYHFPMSGFIFGGKYDFATWFGSINQDDQEFPVGINILPVTASSVYLARDANYLKEKIIGWFFSKFGSIKQWNEVFWVYYAMAEPHKALSQYQASPHGIEEPCPPSETEPHSYYWLHSMCELGPYNSTIQANTPSFSVFKNYYTAFNPGPEEITVTFTDGVNFKVPPGEIVAYKQSNNIGKDLMKMNYNNSFTFQRRGQALHFVFSLAEKGLVSLYDVKGKRIAEFSVNKGISNHTIPFHTLSAGLYVIDINTGAYKHLKKKILIH